MNEFIFYKGDNTTAVMANLRFEVVRFGIYLSIPIIATTIYSQPECINMIVANWKYITYPKQGVTREELNARMKEIAKEE